MSLEPDAPAISPLDTKFLRRSWQELSKYCHFQAKPIDTWESPERSFQKEGFARIHAVLDRFEVWRMSGSRGVLLPDTMPPESRAIYERFVAREIDADRARRLLDLLTPILRKRRR